MRKEGKSRTERTFMKPDQFKGDEMKVIKQLVQDIVLKEYEEGKVLRTTVISSDWKEEAVDEWTDTTKTAIRHRVTRSVTAQAAVKADGKVLLLTLDISKDRQSDGTWAALKGHIMFTDPMLETNVNKEEPK